MKVLGDISLPPLALQSANNVKKSSPFSLLPRVPAASVLSDKNYPLRLFYMTETAADACAKSTWVCSETESIVGHLNTLEWRKLDHSFWYFCLRSTVIEQSECLLQQIVVA